MNALVDDFKETVDFVAVYIQEAHPIDGWYFKKNPYQIKQHTSILDRVRAANHLTDTLAMTLVVDDITNMADFTYDAKPDRLYVIENGILAYVGGKGPAKFDVEELRIWLNARFTPK